MSVLSKLDEFVKQKDKKINGVFRKMCEFVIIKINK